jgi:hypothetical protein
MFLTMVNPMLLIIIFRNRKKRKESNRIAAEQYRARMNPQRDLPSTAVPPTPAALRDFPWGFHTPSNGCC